MDAESGTHTADHDSSNPEATVKKLSHVCVFGDCKKGKKAGTEYCNVHRKIGKAGREKLASSIKKRATVEQKSPHGDKIPALYSPKSDQPTTPIELKDESDRDFAIVLGLVFFTAAFISLSIAIKSEDDICAMGGMFQFILGVLLVGKLSEKHRELRVIFTILIIFMCVGLFMVHLDHEMSNVGGAADFSGWGGP